MSAPQEKKLQKFDFGRYLDERECRVLAAPSKWKWIGTHLPSKVNPLRIHRKKKWLLDPAHGHAPPHREAFLALAGTTVACLGRNIYPITPGTVILFNHSEFHGLKPIPGENNFRHLWLHFPSREQMSTNIFSVDVHGVSNDLPLKVRTDAFVQLLFDVWSNCAEHPGQVLEEAFLKCVFTTAFLEALGRPAREPVPEIEKEVVASIESYIAKHLSESLTLHCLAKLAGYSPFAFHRIFKRHRGVTLHRHIMLARLHEAQKLLIKGYNVESIAEAVGLSSSAVFSRFFKSHAELTPSSWRTLNRYDIV